MERGEDRGVFDLERVLFLSMHFKVQYPSEGEIILLQTGQVENAGETSRSNNLPRGEFSGEMLKTPAAEVDDGRNNLVDILKRECML